MLFYPAAASLLLSDLQDTEEARVRVLFLSLLLFLFIYLFMHLIYIAKQISSIPQEQSHKPPGCTREP